MRISKKSTHTITFSTIPHKLKETFTYFLIYHFFLFSSGAYAVKTQNYKEDETKNPASITIKQANNTTEAFNSQEDDTPSHTPSSSSLKEAQDSFSGRLWGFYTTAKGIVSQNVSSLSEWFFNTNQKSFIADARELPFFGEDISSLGIWHTGKDVNKEASFSLHKGQKKGSFKTEQFSSEAYNLTLTSFLASFGKGVIKGVKFAVQHPLQAIVMGLSAQVVASAAFRTSAEGNPDSRYSLSKRALGDEFAITNSTIADQQGARVRSLANGNVFIGWQGNQNGNLDVYGRIFTIDGIPLTDEFILNQPDIWDQRNLGVASLENGNIFTIWEGNQAGTYYDIYGRIFATNGTAVSDEFLVNQATANHQFGPSLTRLANGNVFATWHGPQPGNYDVYGRIFAANGTALSDEFLLNFNVTDHQLNSVVSKSNENVFVVWEGFQTGNTDIYGRLFTQNGTALGEESRLNQVTNNIQEGPAVTSLPNGNIFVAWHGLQTGIYNIYGRLFTQNGTELGDEFRLSQNRALYLAVKSLTNGNIFATWREGNDPNYDIYGRYFAANGTALGNEFRINQITPGSQVAQNIENLANGNIFISWQGDQTSKYNIYGRIINTDLLVELGGSTTGELTTNQMTTSLATTGELTTNILTTNDFTTGFVSTTTLGQSHSSQRETSSTLGIGIGAGVAGAAVLTIGGVAAWKYYKYKKDKNSTLRPGSTELKEVSLISEGEDRFKSTPGGYTSHPTILGALHKRTYEIWKDKISVEEAKLAQSFIAKKIPFSAKDFVLGRGNFGSTYIGAEQSTNNLYAIKEVYGRDAVDDSNQEGKLQYKLKECPHIMTLVDYRGFEPKDLTDQPRLFQVMPLAYTNGTGYKQLVYSMGEESLELREKVVGDSFHQLMSGLDYMHSKGIYHLDIKDDNILYMADGSLRIGDLGRARELGLNAKITDYRMGDRRFFSPEQFAFIRYGMNKNGKEIVGKEEIIDSFPAWTADSWQGGLYILGLLVPNDPLNEAVASYETKVSSWTNATFQRVLNNTPVLQEGTSTSFKGLLRGVLSVNFKERLKPGKVMKTLPSSVIVSSENREQFFKNIILMQNNQEGELNSTKVFHVEELYTFTSKEEDKNYAYNTTSGDRNPQKSLSKKEDKETKIPYDNTNEE